MFEVLEKCLESKVASLADLVQIRGQRRFMSVCSVQNGFVEEFSNITLSGVGVRALVDKMSWGFSSTNTCDETNALKTLETAVKLAKASVKSKTQKIELEPIRGVVTDISARVRKPPSEASSEEIAQIPFQAYKGAKEAGPDIVNATASYIGIQDEKFFASSEGARIRQASTRVLLMVNAVARKTDVICPASETAGHTGGLELFDERQPYDIGKYVGLKAINLLSAKAPPSGKFRSVIQPNLCATLLHEAIGHPLEADLAMAGGGFGKQIGALASSKLITIYDDGSVPSGLGYFPYDDEGVKCERTVLIENGVLRSFMHDRTSAAATGVSPTGNSHAWDYSVEPLIRQTNIGIEPGDYKLEEMIEDISEGLLIEGTFGGQADSNADFTFGFQSARWIRKGETAELLRGANLAGNAIQVFKTIDAVSDKAVLRPGACGKYQFAVQGRIVPAIRCEITVGGTGG